ncbi:uroporphyrinogen-III synthase [Paracoccus homiensis]|uniref:Uroporphyrinogen-III synthase n=1 Tax=Paracoccus homiensis TaxID=364199 RepID=A0A1I0IFC6_9RHOB|nr:uroporphyrinogen-III synthase [Paracoccus homiensis]SET95594.1 uroporphyrinogen-III synthase [Paracoccus homiensis]
MPSLPSCPLLLTRPESDSRRLAAMMPDLRSLISPILQINPVAHDPQPLWDSPGLVFTSAHAVPFAGEGGGRIALCVGGHTARHATAAGFQVIVGDGTALGMLPLIKETGVPLIHPHGRHLARELPVPGVVVYDQVEQPLSAAARLLLSGPGPVVLPVFSPRSARLLSRQVAAAGAPLRVAAISEAAMAAWHGPVAAQAVSLAPTIEAMVATIRHLAVAEPR